MEVNIHINCDTSEIQPILSELNLYIGKLPLEIREFLLGLFDSPAKIFRLENGPAAVGAGLTVLLKPTDLLLDLLSACRTGNFENLVVKREPHNNLLHETREP
jgi:hypothetical protein